MNREYEKLARLRLFLTTEHTCSYLPNRRARNLVADPQTVDSQVATQLARFGFRRSGDHIYRPHCTDCAECLSIRIPVHEFKPNRSQRRNWNRNQDLRVEIARPSFHGQHYRLFLRYLKARHPNGGMDDFLPENYSAIIASAWSQTLLYEFRDDHRLLAVAVVDRLDEGLSSVYTFFEPEETVRGLGTFAILWQIHAAQQAGMRWVYLGYWIQECRKMRYKAGFQPCEIFLAGKWTRHLRT